MSIVVYSMKFDRESNHNNNPIMSDPNLSAKSSKGGKEAENEIMRETEEERQKRKIYRAENFKEGIKR